MIIVAKFGCRGFVEHEELAVHEMRTAAQYFNALVSIERWKRREYAAIRSRWVPGLSEMEAADEQIREWIEEQRDAIREKRRATSVALAKPPKRAKPTKQVDATEEKNEIEELFAWKKELASRLKVARAEFAELVGPAELEYKLRTSGGKEGDNWAKRDLNASAREEMLGEEQWHEAWKELARLEATAYSLREWVFEASGKLNHGTYVAVRDDVVRAGKRPPPRPDGQPRKPKERPQFGRARYRKFGWQVSSGAKRVTWADVLAGRCSSFVITDVRSARTPTPMGQGGRRNPQNHSPKELAKRAREGAGNGNRSKQSYVTARVRIGMDGRTPVWVGLNTYLHRQIPDDAVVRWVYVVPREEENGIWTYSLQVTLEVARPLTERAPGIGVATVQLGWTKTDKGDLQVASVDGQPEVELPAALVEGFAIANSLRGASDRWFDVAREALCERIAADPTAVPAWLLEEARNAAHWRRHDRLTRIVRRWVRETEFPVPLKELWGRWKQSRDAIKKISGREAGDYFSIQEVVGEWLRGNGVTSELSRFVVWLEWWRRKDRHLEQMGRAARRRSMNRRRDIYRCFAAELSTKVEKVEIAPLDLASVALRDMPEAKAKELHQAARHQRVLAAPYELKEALKNAFGPDRYLERSGDDEEPGSARKKREGQKNSLSREQEGVAAE